MKIKVIEREDKSCRAALCVLIVSLVFGFPLALFGLSLNLPVLFLIGFALLIFGFAASFLVHFSIKYVEKEIEVPENALGLNEHTRVVVFDGKKDRDIILDEALLVKIEPNPYGE